MEGWPARREWGRERGLLDRVTAEGKGGKTDGPGIWNGGKRGREGRTEKLKRYAF